MADNSFRSFRRDASARDDGTATRGVASDPLAELARLIGQSDNHGARSRDFGQPAEAFGHSDWGSVDDEYAADRGGDEQNYAPARTADFYRAPPSDQPGEWARDPANAEEPVPAPRGYPAFEDLRANSRDVQDVRY